MRGEKERNFHDIISRRHTEKQQLTGDHDSAESSRGEGGRKKAAPYQEILKITSFEPKERSHIPADTMHLKQLF